MPIGFGLATFDTKKVGAQMNAAPAPSAPVMQPMDAQVVHLHPAPIAGDPPAADSSLDPNLRMRQAFTSEEHSPTATKLAVGEALQRIGNGVRHGEYQQPKSALAIDQLRRAGLSEVEIKLLSASGGI